MEPNNTKENMTRVVVHNLGTMVASAFAISTLQWVCIQFLATYCAPWSFWGPMLNFFYLGSPVCHAVNKLQIHISDYYIGFWVVSVAFMINAVKTAIPINHKVDNE